MVLAAVDDLDIQDAPVGRPADVRQVSLFAEVLDIQVDGLPRQAVVHPQGNQFGVHPVHRVLDGDEAAGAGLDVQEGEIRHAGFVFPVKGEFRAVRRPEDAAVDAEFIPADALAEDQVAPVGKGDCRRIGPVGDEQAVALAEGLPGGGHRHGLARESLRRLPLAVLEVGIGVVILPPEVAVLGDDGPVQDDVLHRQELAGRVAGGMDIEDARLGKKCASGKESAQKGYRGSHLLQEDFAFE